MILLFMAWKGADAQPLLDKGWEKIEMKDYYGAIYDFSSFLKENPNSAEAYAGRAKARLEIEDVNNAEKDAEQAIEKDPDYEMGYAVLAEIQSSAREYGKALSNINKAYQINPDDPYILNRKIFILFLNDQKKEAEELLDKALESYPEYSAFYLTSGIINNDDQKYRKALNNYNKAMNLPAGRDKYNILINRGISNMRLLEYDRALEDFSQALNINSEGVSALRGRGRVYYVSGDYELAVEDFEKALELDDNNPILYYNLAMSYLRLEDLTNACMNFQRSCKLGNKNACRKVLFECTENVTDF
jgi:tetratricopeptide (TPR) repeat protein